jgi:hypothetical protein
MSPALRMKFHLRIDFGRVPLTGNFYPFFNLSTRCDRMSLNLSL